MASIVTAEGLFLAVRGPARRSREQALPSVHEVSIDERVLVGVLAD